MKNNGTRRGNSILIQAWLNRSDPVEAQALEVREAAIARGFTDRQILVDALLRAQGYTPEMFRQAGGQSAQIIQGVQNVVREEFERNQAELLAAFGKEVVKLIKQRGLAAVDEDDEDSAPAASSAASPFMKNFASSFVNRQRQAQGDDDE